MVSHYYFEGEEYAIDRPYTHADPLAFRPNPQNLVDQDSEGSGAEDNGAEDGSRSGVYRPPKIAPVPYSEATMRKTKDKTRRPVPTALTALKYVDESSPYVESTSGLGGHPTGNSALSSGRARELARMREYEEENMTRLVMTKKEARRRKMDEEDIALGGTGVGVLTGSGRRKRGGAAALESEFLDVFKSVGGKSGGGAGREDGYEELRAKGRNAGAFARAKDRSGRGMDDEGIVDEGPRGKKRSRFEQETKAAKKRMRR